MEENLRSENEKQEIMRLSSMQSKTEVKNSKNYCAFYVIKKKEEKKKSCVCMYKMYTFSIST